MADIMTRKKITKYTARREDGDIWCNGWYKPKCMAMSFVKYTNFFNTPKEVSICIDELIKYKNIVNMGYEVIPVEIEVSILPSISTTPPNPNVPPYPFDKNWRKPLRRFQTDNLST